MRHEPQQARAVVTYNKLVTAARKLYDDPDIGRDRMTTAMIVAEAGVSIGTFYRYFDERVDIMDAIYPERDYPNLEILQAAARWGGINDGTLEGQTAREATEFLQGAML